MSTALILAAGLGTRLRTVTSGPKWLVKVGSTSPMVEQLRAIDATGGFDKVIVVASGDTSLLHRELDDLGPLTPVEVIDNPDAHRWNNWSSALIGLDYIEDADVVLFNSDLFASREWFSDSLRSITTSPTPALLIDSERPLTDEAMKVAGKGAISSIGKVGISSPTGEYVGMAWWPAGTSRSLTAVLRKYREDPKNHQKWYEHGIQDDIDAGKRYSNVATPSVAWVEIDDEHDHETAERLIRPPRSPQGS